MTQCTAGKLCSSNDQITDTFPNVNGEAVKVWEWISNFIPHYIIFIIDVITFPVSVAYHDHVSQRGADKMAATFQTKPLNIFSGIKTVAF